MIKIENTNVVGFEDAIRGMHNPMNSWDKSDSIPGYEDNYNQFTMGSNDHDLMMKLAKAGSVHAKFRRMIVVYVDLTAPLYWWKEFDTYKVGTVANSCSTMHKIQEKEFTLDDFSHEHLIYDVNDSLNEYFHYLNCLDHTLNGLNSARDHYLKTGDKKYWWQMIQLLPTSYNQRRTIMFSYEVLAGLYPMRKDHKLDEWHRLCEWIRDLPYSELITGEKQNDGSINWPVPTGEEPCK